MAKDSDLIDAEVGWTVGDQKAYWKDVTETEAWFHQFITDNFAHVRAGSGDTWDHLHALKVLLEERYLEGVVQPYWDDLLRDTPED